MPHKLYSTTERNQAQGTLKNCSQCSARKKRRCLAKSSKLGKDNHFSPMKTARFIDQGALRPVPEDIKGQMINRRHGFKIKIPQPEKRVGGRLKFKVIPVIYGRITDRYGKQIHP